MQGFKRIVAEERDNGQRIEIDIVADASKVDEALDEFYDLMGRVRKLQGTAEGRSSSEARLKEMLGEAEVEAASTDFLLNLFTMEAVRELGIDTVLTPGARAEAPPRRGCDFTFAASVVPRPCLSLSDTGPVRVGQPCAVVEEKDVDAQIAYSAEQCAEYRKADHASIREGDFALMDVELSKNGEPCKSLSGIRRRVEIAEGLVPAGFIDGVRGMGPGDQRGFSFMVQGDDPAQQPDRYEAAVKVHEVLERVVPAVDDGWVERVLPEYGTLAGFRSHLRAELEQQRQRVEWQELMYRARSALERRLVGSIPDEMYQEAKDSLMESTLAEIDALGKTLEEYCEEHGTTKDAFNVQVFMQAAETLRQNLALEVLARERGIVETEDELARAKAALSPAIADLPDGEFERRGFKASLRESIRRQKALSWLLETAVIES